MSIVDRPRKFSVCVRHSLTPSDRAWHGASVAVQLVTAKPLFDADGIARISFVFDGSDKGAIIMDDISIRPAFRPEPPVTKF